jgi:hypothetical protein
VSDRVKEIKERLEAASKGEWEWSRDDGGDFNGLMGEDGCLLEGLSGGRVSVSEDDAALIAHAPADLKWLLEENARLEAEVSHLRAAAYVIGSKPLPEGATRGYAKEKP